MRLVSLEVSKQQYLKAQSWNLNQLLNELMHRALIRLRDVIPCPRNSFLFYIVPSLIKSPQYTGGDFMFLSRFVRRRWRRRRRRRRRLRRRPQILVHAITFEQLFGFLSFLAQLLALTCRLPD